MSTWLSICLYVCLTKCPALHSSVIVNAGWCKKGNPGLCERECGVMWGGVLRHVVFSDVTDPQWVTETVIRQRDSDIFLFTAHCHHQRARGAYEGLEPCTSWREETTQTKRKHVWFICRKTFIAWLLWCTLTGRPYVPHILNYLYNCFLFSPFPAGSNWSWSNDSQAKKLKAEPGHLEMVGTAIPAIGGVRSK